MDKGLVISAIILRLIIARFSYKCISRYSHTLILDFLYIFPKIDVIQLQVDIKNLVFNKIKLHVNLFFILVATNWRRPFLYLIYNNICSYFHSDWIISLAIGVAILYLKKQTNKHKNQTTTTTTTKQSKGRNFCSS